MISYKPVIFYSPTQTLSVTRVMVVVVVGGVCIWAVGDMTQDVG